MRALALIAAGTLSAAAIFFPAEPGWRRHTVFKGPCCTDGTRLADFDQDGSTDIVTSLEEAGDAILVFRFPSAWLPVAISAGAIRRPEDTLPIDVNGDGFPDLLASQENRSHRHTLCLNPGNAADARRPDRWRCSTVPASEGRRSWILAEPINVPGSQFAIVTAGKTSEDGKSGSIALFTGAGPDPAGWRLQTLDAKAEWVMSMMVADINGDGREDVAFVDRKGWARGLSWLEQPAEPGAPWARHRASRGVDNAMDGHQHAGLFFSLEHAGRWEIVGYRLPAGRAELRLPLPAAWCEPRSFAVANFDNDPADEVAVLCTTTRFQMRRIVMLELDGHGAPKTIASTPGYWWSQTKYDVGHAVDMDGDGDMDLLTDEEVYGGDGLGVIWYENPTR